MSEHPIVTQLSAEQLPGYAIAMEEAAERARDTADQDWLADRAAIARGILAREARIEAEMQAREFPFHLVDNPDLTFDSLADMLEGCDAMHPIQFCQHGQPDRWAVLWPTADGAHEFSLYDSEQEADDFILTAGENHPDAVMPLDAIAAGPGEPAETFQRYIDAALPAEADAATAAEECQPKQTAAVEPVGRMGLEELASLAATGGENPPPPPATEPPSASRKWTQLSEVEQATVQQMFESGVTAPAISTRVGVAQHAVYYQANKQGWRFKPATAAKPTEDDMAEARTNIGRGAKWIAEEYGWELATAQRLVASWRAEAAAA